MKVVYVASGMTLTFVINEMEAHARAGWDILPVASRKPESTEKLSKLNGKWCGRTAYRSSTAMQCALILREMVCHPIRFFRMLFWVLVRFFDDWTEFAKAVYEIGAACDFARHCRRFGAEHIHVHFASRSLSLGIMLGILTKLDVSCTVHAFDIFTRTAASLRPRLLKCRFISAISEFNIRYLNDKCGPEVAGLCRLVRCGIDVERFKTVDRRPVAGRIVCVGNLVQKKGYPLAIDACAALKARGVKFEYQIVGDGPDREAIEAQIERLGLHDDVKLLGRITNDRLADWLCEASVFLMACVQTEQGDMDGIPVAMVEAMACGVPVVSRAISGVPELVLDGVNGLLVDTKDPEALADAVERLLSDPEKAREFGRLGRKHVLEQFDIELTAEHLRELIGSGGCEA